MADLIGRCALRFAVFMTFLFLLGPTLIILLFSFYPSAYITFPPPALTLHWYAEAFRQQSLFIQPLLTSLQISLIATVISAVIGTLAAFGVVRYRVRFQSTLNSFLVAPLLIPTLIVGLAGMLFLNAIGMLGTYAGLIAGHVVVTLAFIIQSVSVSLATLDTSVEEAATSLGSSPWRVLRRVTLPMVVPGLFAGAVFAWVTSFDELPLTLLLSTPKTLTLPVQLYGYLQQRSDPTFAAVSVLLIAISFGLLLILQKIGGLDKRIY
jgi:putative spermidine/putrescine transport system permease protein